MRETKIENIAYKLKRNLDANRPGAIVFIGAGCSVSAKIPLGKGIVDFVLKNYKDNPNIKSLHEDSTYAELMACLDPQDRKEIFKHFVEKAKINVSHIYLAQLMAMGYVDYIVTVNFDNLALRALALYNIFPPIYDIAILKDFTTTTLQQKSVIYLHGQYNGLWQLNTQEEMDKIIKGSIPKTIFDKISNDRPWIVVGYGAEDPIFDQLLKLGRFDNGLYWIAYKDEVSSKVEKNLLDKENTESFVIKGYDADSFFLKLNAALIKDEPKIFQKPFTFLAELIDSVVDIDEKDEYKSVKERLAESKKLVQDAISKYETTDSTVEKMTDEEIKQVQLRNALINCLVKGEYDAVEKLIAQLGENPEAETLLIISNIFFNWGTDILETAIKKSGTESESLYKEAAEKYAKAVEVKPDNYEAYNNWGNVLENLAKMKSGTESESLYKEAVEKYSKAIEIKPDDHEAYYNWGNVLENLAKMKSGTESESLYKGAIEKYVRAIEIKPDDHETYFNWGIVLENLAEMKSGTESESLYKEAVEKYSKALAIKPDDHETYYNWGDVLENLAKMKSGTESESLYKEAIEKYTKAIEVKPDDNESYYNWGIVLENLAEMKSGTESESLYKEAIEKYMKVIEIKPDEHEAYYNWGSVLIKLALLKEGEEAEKLLIDAEEILLKSVELGGPRYNLACLYAVKNNKTDAFDHLEKCLKSAEVNFSYVEEDADWNSLRNEPIYYELKTKYSN